MKLNGFVGKGTGKLGASVFAISGGEQIVRQYNPNVANPQTESQVAQRAKLKLMSQLAADLASSIAFRKQGLVSARNKFVSANIGKAEIEEGNANIDLTSIDLTGSSAPLANISATAGSGGVYTIKLASAAPADVARVVYGVYKRGADGQLALVQNVVVQDAGENEDFPTDVQLTSGHHVVYAYGIKDKSTKATVKFEDYVTDDTASIAMLDVLSGLSVSDYALTATYATLVNA